MRKKISTYAKENDLTYHTVWNMVKRGELKSIQLESGTILIDEDDYTLDNFIDLIKLYSIKIYGKEKGSKLYKKIISLMEL